MKPKRHVTAKTEVEVYRLSKVRDAARAMRNSSDDVVKALAYQIEREADVMLANYCDAQNKIIQRELKADLPKRRR